jgi:hypothetical protein
MRTLETSNNSYVSQIKNLHIPTTMNAALPLPFAANGSSCNDTYMQNISGISTTSIDTTDASVADISTSMCHDEYLRAMVYPACGHVFGFNSRLQETSRCPLCRTKSKVSMGMGIDVISSPRLITNPPHLITLCFLLYYSSYSFPCHHIAYPGDFSIPTLHRLR